MKLHQFTKRCAVEGCPNGRQFNGDNHYNKEFYDLPTENPKLCEQWLAVIGHSDDCNTNKRVCGDHFKEEDIIDDPNNFKKSLKPNVVPSVKLPVKVCRTCALHITTTYYTLETILNMQGIPITLRDLLKYCVISIDKGGLPHPVICETCLAKLQLAYMYKMSLVLKLNTASLGMPHGATCFTCSASMQSDFKAIEPKTALGSCLKKIMNSIPEHKHDYANFIPSVCKTCEEMLNRIVEFKKQMRRIDRQINDCLKDAVQKETTGILRRISHIQNPPSGLSIPAVSEQPKLEPLKIMKKRIHVMPENTVTKAAAPPEIINAVNEKTNEEPPKKNDNGKKRRAVLRWTPKEKEILFQAVKKSVKSVTKKRLNIGWQQVVLKCREKNCFGNEDELKRLWGRLKVTANKTPEFSRTLLDKQILKFLRKQHGPPKPSKKLPCTQSDTADSGESRPVTVTNNLNIQPPVTVTNSLDIQPVNQVINTPGYNSTSQITHRPSPKISIQRIDILSPARVASGPVHAMNDESFEARNYIPPGITVIKLPRLEVKNNEKEQKRHTTDINKNLDASAIPSCPGIQKVTYSFQHASGDISHVTNSSEIQQAQERIISGNISKMSSPKTKTAVVPKAKTDKHVDPKTSKEKNCGNKQKRKLEEDTTEKSKLSPRPMKKHCNDKEKQTTSYTLVNSTATTSKKSEDPSRPKSLVHAKVTTIRKSVDEFEPSPQPNKKYFCKQTIPFNLVNSKTTTFKKLEDKNENIETTAISSFSGIPYNEYIEWGKRNNVTIIKKGNQGMIPTFSQDESGQIARVANSSENKPLQKHMTSQNLIKTSSVQTKTVVVPKTKAEKYIGSIPQDNNMKKRKHEGKTLTRSVDKPPRTPKKKICKEDEKNNMTSDLVNGAATTSKKAVDHSEPSPTNKEHIPEQNKKATIPFSLHKFSATTYIGSIPQDNNMKKRKHEGKTLTRSVDKPPRTPKKKICKEDEKNNMTSDLVNGAATTSKKAVDHSEPSPTNKEHIPEQNKKATIPFSLHKFSATTSKFDEGANILKITIPLKEDSIIVGSNKEEDSSSSGEIQKTKVLYNQILNHSSSSDEIQKTIRLEKQMLYYKSTEEIIEGLKECLQSMESGSTSDQSGMAQKVDDEPCCSKELSGENTNHHAYATSNEEAETDINNSNSEIQDKSNINSQTENENLMNSESQQQEQIIESQKQEEIAESQEQEENVESHDESSNSSYSSSDDSQSQSHVSMDDIKRMFNFDPFQYSFNSALAAVQEEEIELNDKINYHEDNNEVIVIDEDDDAG